MNPDANRGDKVKFTGENVGVWQEEQAKKVLVVGQVYEVDVMIVSTFSVFVKLKGFKENFNSAMFEDA